MRSAEWLLAELVKLDDHFVLFAQSYQLNAYRIPWSLWGWLDEGWVPVVEPVKDGEGEWPDFDVVIATLVGRLADYEALAFIASGDVLVEGAGMMRRRIRLNVGALPTGEVVGRVMGQDGKVDEVDVLDSGGYLAEVLPTLWRKDP